MKCFLSLHFENEVLAILSKTVNFVSVKEIKGGNSSIGK